MRRYLGDAIHGPGREREGVVKEEASISAVNINKR